MNGFRRFNVGVVAIALFAFLAFAPSALAAVTITASPYDVTDTPITTLTVGQVFHSGVSVGGTTGAGGDLTFYASAPDDPGCTGAQLDFVSFPGIGGDSGFHSGGTGTVATQTGQYRMSATLTGGPDGGASLSCANAFMVNKTHPSVAVVPSAATVAAGSPIHATATLTGAYAPLAPVTVRIYGPDDPTCAGIAPVSSGDVPGPGPTYAGPVFTPTTVGTYHAKAIFEGDADNDGDTANCGPSTAFEVTPAPSPGGGGSPAVTPPAGDTGQRAAALKKCKKKKGSKAKKKCKRKAAKLPS